MWWEILFVVLLVGAIEYFVPKNQKADADQSAAGERKGDSG